MRQIAVRWERAEDDAVSVEIRMLHMPSTVVLPKNYPNNYPRMLNYPRVCGG